jgi:hypothetical protein
MSVRCMSPTCAPRRRARRLGAWSPNARVGRAHAVLV